MDTIVFDSTRTLKVGQIDARAVIRQPKNLSGMTLVVHRKRF